LTVAIVVAFAPQLSRAEVPEGVESKLQTMYSYIDWKTGLSAIQKAPQWRQALALDMAMSSPLEFTFDSDVFVDLQNRNFVPSELRGVTVSRPKPTLIVEISYCKDQAPHGWKKNDGECEIVASSWVPAAGMLVRKVDGQLKSSHARIYVDSEGTNKHGANVRLTAFREYEFEPYSPGTPAKPHNWKLIAHDEHVAQAVPSDCKGVYIMWPWNDDIVPPEK
jgi:hypothetical protein